MSRLRRWLIRRLGGYTYLWRELPTEQKPKAKSMRIETITFERFLESGEITPEDKEFAARRIGEHMLQSGFIKCSIEKNEQGEPLMTAKAEAFRLNYK